MKETEREFFKSLRERLPSSYAKILISRYKNKNLPYSSSLIYKVAYGERVNAIILNDLLELATQNQLAKKRIEIFRNRLKKSKSKV